MSTREALPTRRRNYTQHCHVGGHSIYFSAGMYPDGRLGELFIDLAKEGAVTRYWAHGAATLFSLALQYGAPLATLVEMFHGAQAEPCGAVEGHARITECTSIMDLIVRSLAIDFLGRDDLADLPRTEEATDGRVAG